METKRLHVPDMILIGSTGKNSGKTYLGTRITGRLTGRNRVEVLKIAAICRGAVCIYGKEGCGICERFPGGYRLDEENDAASGKDTSLYLKAGASRAVLMKSTRESMLEGFKDFLRTVEGGGLIICESNSLAEFVEPGLFIMVQGPGDIKPSAAKVMGYADVVCRLVR